MYPFLSRLKPAPVLMAGNPCICFVTAAQMPGLGLGMAQVLYPPFRFKVRQTPCHRALTRNFLISCYIEDYFPDKSNPMMVYGVQRGQDSSTNGVIKCHPPVWNATMAGGQ